MRVVKNLVGIRFGRLVVVSLNDHETILRKRTSWNCVCDCGKLTVVFNSALTSGNSTSCGCKRLETKTTHGLSQTKIYKVWKDMMSRCYSESATNYKNYGARGMTVSESWKNPVNFKNDMESSYRFGLELNRIDNELGYCKENCNWITHEENCKNTRRSFLVEINGENLSLKDISIKYKIDYVKLRNRWYRGYRNNDLIS